MKLQTRPATPDEQLNIDPEAEDLPDGVFAIDFGEYPVFCDLEPGSHIVESEGVSGLRDGKAVIQVHDEMDGGFLKELK